MALALIRTGQLYIWKGPSLLVTDGGERGRNWEGHTRRSSVYTRAALHPGATLAVLAALALGAGVAAAASRQRG